jgi:hypothetical protein
VSTVGWPAAKLYADAVFRRENIGAAEDMLTKIRTMFQ